MDRKQKVIISLVVCVLLLGCFSLNSFADSVPQLSQTINLVETLPTNCTFKTRYSSLDPWLTFTRHYGPVLGSPTSTFDSYFPVDSNGNRVSKNSAFRGEPTIAQESEYTETYSLPSFDFSFDHCYTSLVYVVEIDNTGSTDWEITDSNIILTKSDGTTQNYSGLLKTSSISGTGNIIRFILQFDCSLVTFSSDISSFTITLFFEHVSLPQSTSNITFRTNLFPFIVTSDYEGVELFTAATFTLLQNNILPSIENLTQTMHNLQSQNASIAAQQSQQFSALQSQQVVQHSQQMAALQSLPQAQADAQIAAAQSNAQAQADAEINYQQGLISSFNSNIPDLGSISNALGNLVSVLNNHDSNAIFEIPSITVPALNKAGVRANLSPAYKLTDAYQVDLSSYVQYVPNWLLVTGRLLFTGGVLFACVKKYIKWFEGLLNADNASVDSVADDINPL